MILASSKNNEVKLSIIMPCYNVEQTLGRALRSVICQKADFSYEILIVDDASTDGTLQLAQDWQTQYPQIRILCNEQNRGNAYSFYTALCESQGEYFCVLDGDDYYTVSDKLQRQIDFLDGDVAKEYVGTATQYIVDLENDMIHIPPRSKIREFNYVDFLTSHSGYYHTATYMYRNIFRGNVPAEMSEILYRGDTPRTMFHLKYSGKKIRVLDFVGSAYVYGGNGLWSGLKQTQQFEYQVNYQTKHRERVTTEFERTAAEDTILKNRALGKMAKDEPRRYPEITVDAALESIQYYAKRFAFAQKDFVLEKVYYSQYIDSLLETLGYIQRIHHPEYCQTTADPNKLCIIEGILNPMGGGIFAELEQLVTVFQDKEVYLFVTNMPEIPHEVAEFLQKHKNLALICAPKEVSSRLGWFRKRFVEISPARCYCYCSHHDVIGPALIERGICENLAMVSFDHGYLCGISNSALDSLIAKRDTDYFLLSASFPKKNISLIPAWSKGAIDCEGLSYRPFAEHKQLITACGSARFYKVDGRPPYRYLDMIFQLLQRTRGKHYHFGPLPEGILEEIDHRLRELDLPQSCFIHIPWAENIPQTLLKEKVDVFIEPFPVVSYKLSLEVLSAGVPIIARKSLRRMETTDFIPPDSMYWSTAENFVALLDSLTEEKLQQASYTAKQYFEDNFSESVVTEKLQKNIGISHMNERLFTFADDRVLDIADSLRLIGRNFVIDIQRQCTAQSAANKPKYSKWTIFCWNSKQSIKRFLKQAIGNTPLYDMFKEIYFKWNDRKVGKGG